MTKSHYHILHFLFIITNFFGFSATACSSTDVSQFPANNQFASAGEGIWDNGASCGRQYLVRCISASVQGVCIYYNCGYYKIVANTTMTLSAVTFSMIADASASEINIEFQQ
ncbi:hypothetical protein MKX01_011765 [Papaver californicum]|nr:hypothetical protein MKX01_011765 [Papaver californicum]